jgi:hypothetical protein
VWCQIRSKRNLENPVRVVMQVFNAPIQLLHHGIYSVAGMDLESPVANVKFICIKSFYFTRTDSSKENSMKQSSKDRAKGKQLRKVFRMLALS